MTTSQEQQLRDWQLAMLRFAVTLRDSDRAAALISARMLDMSGAREPGRFSFFERTSLQVCAAICDRHAPDSDAVLRRHIARMDDPRLARSFAAAVGLERKADGRREKPAARSRADLWRGLAEPRRSA